MTGRSPWWKWSSAAAALLITCTAAWFASRPPKPPQIVSVDVNVTGIVGQDKVVPVPSPIPEKLTPVASAKPAPVKMLTDLTVYLLFGSPQNTTDDVPADLAPAIEQMHRKFALKSYKFNDSFVLRGRSGIAITEGILAGSGLRYHCAYRGLRVSGDVPRAVHIDGLTLTLSKSVVAQDGKQKREPVARIDTDADLREGQKTVVAKSSLSSSGDALILVIAPKIVD